MTKMPRSYYRNSLNRALISIRSQLYQMGKQGCGYISENCHRKGSITAFTGESNTTRGGSRSDMSFMGVS